MVDIKKIGSLPSRGAIFQYFCQGESHSRKLLLSQGNVNKPVADVCTTSREVRIAFKQNPPYFEVDTYTNTMVESEYPDNYYHGHGRDYEILSPFLRSHNLIPRWQDAELGRSYEEEISEYLVSGIYLAF